MTTNKKSEPPAPEVSGRISEIIIHYGWYDIFSIRLWLSCDRHDDPGLIKAMLSEWCADRWGRGAHTLGFTNQTERDDLQRLGAIATKIMLDLDADAVEVMDVKAGIGAVEYQRWDQ